MEGEHLDLSPYFKVYVSSDKQLLDSLNPSQDL